MLMIILNISEINGHNGAVDFGGGGRRTENHGLIWSGVMGEPIMARGNCLYSAVDGPRGDHLRGGGCPFDVACGPF